MGSEMTRRSAPCALVAIVTFLLMLVGCGSGNNSGGTPPPVKADFSVSLFPSSLSVTGGSSTTFKVSLQPLNGFTGTATVAVSGLPTGVTLVPGSSFSVSASSAQDVTVQCASTVPSGAYALQISASSGSLSHSATEALTVQAATPDFTISLAPSSLAFPAGGNGTFQVVLQATGGFSDSVQVQVSGLPAGVTLTPGASFQLLPSSPQSVTVAVPGALAPGSYGLTITGTSGALTHTAIEAMMVQSNGAPPPSRADFVRTDDSPGAAVYDRAHQRVYVTNPKAGTVDVISSVTYQILRRIPVPSPAGIDISPDYSTVFIGTQTEAVYALDTSTMAMTARYFTPIDRVNAASVNFATPIAPVAAPDGTALISLLDKIVKWNPATGEVTTVLTNPAAAFQYGPVSPMAESADRSKVILSNDYDPSTVNVYDTQTNSFLPPLNIQGFAYSVAASPDGTRFAVAANWDAYGQLITLLDSNLQTIKTAPGGGYLQYSADGKYIYVVGELGSVPVVGLLDSTTLQMVGTAPSYASNIAYFGRVPPALQEKPLTVDETGRIFGSADHGLAIDDATDLRTYTGNEVYPIWDIIVEPDDGPVNQAKSVQILTQAYSAIPSIWFGSLPATETSIGGTYLSTKAPALNQPGPVNVRLDGADKVQGWIPQAYTYGTVLSDGPDLAASAIEPSTIHIFGYGLADYDTAGGATLALGSGNGTIAKNTLYPAEQPYPFPLWDMQATTPQIAVGSGDVSVTTNWGSSRRHAVYHALDIHSYPLDGLPYSMAYDAKRRQVYVSVPDHIDVFSIASRAFVSSIQVPTLNNAKQLGGVSITPDGKWLLAANYLDGSVALIDPDNLSGAQAIAVGTPPNVWGQGPSQLASTNTGKVFVSTGGQPDTISLTAARKQSLERQGRAQLNPADTPAPEPSVWILDLGTKTAAPFGPAQNSPLAPFIAASADGAEVCLSGLYLPMTLYHSATGLTDIGPGMQGPTNCGVGGSVAAGSLSNGGQTTIYDLTTRKTGILSIADYEDNAIDPFGVFIDGIAIDSTGALVYVPFMNNIGLFDAHSGELREVIALAHTMYDFLGGSIVVNETGDQIFIASAQGLTVIQMDTMPLAVGTISASGSSWTVTGAGFNSGTTAEVDGKLLAVEVPDSHHLTVSNAPDFTAFHTLTLKNPDGHAYTYDAAYFR